MGINDLKIQICQTVGDAPHYNAPEYRTANLNTAVVVRNGVKSGNDTVDLVFTDDKGQKHVAMITARLLKVLADATITNRN
jgi:hypothetical protein